MFRSVFLRDSVVIQVTWLLKILGLDKSWSPYILNTWTNLLNLPEPRSISYLMLFRMSWDILRKVERLRCWDGITCSIIGKFCGVESKRSWRGLKGKIESLWGLTNRIRSGILWCMRKSWFAYLSVELSAGKGSRDWPFFCLGFVRDSVVTHITPYHGHGIYHGHGRFWDLTCGIGLSIFYVGQ